MSTLSPTLSASGREGPDGESQIYILAETGLLVKITPCEEKCEVLWNTDISEIDLLHTINAEEWHTEEVDIDQFDIIRIGHHHVHTTLQDQSGDHVKVFPRFDSVEFSEDIAGTSIYWASEPIPDVQDDYSNRIRIRLPFPLNDRAIGLLEWYYSHFAPAAIREEYERGGDPIRQITTAITEYSP